MTAATQPAGELAAGVFHRWLEAYAAAVESGNAALAADQFVEDGFWRDIISFSWSYRTFSGRGEIERALQLSLPDVRPHNFRVAADRIPPRVVKRSARLLVEGFFDFDTAAGRGTGFARLMHDGSETSESKVWLLLTTLQELHGFEEQVGARRPTGVQYSTNFSGDNWLDQRRKAQQYIDRDPDVLVIGGGQAGLSIAARLGQIGVDALVIERTDRVGDNWRNRYHSLTLHNETWANGLPYLPFPPNWPTFLPKDKLAGWLEGYAEFMELNVWTGADFVGATFDEGAARWTAQIARSDGTTRTLNVAQVVLATGSASGVAKLPALPGLGDFTGEILHSSQFSSGIPYAGKRAVVVGTGNSGHDVAQELQSNGAAAVTIVQRSPTCVVSLVPSGTMVYSLYSEGPAEDIDLITAAVPYPVLRESYQWLTKKTCALDKDLLDSLNAVGFETDFGVDETGFHMMYLRQGGGYYINVGCSDLIADRKIDLLRMRDVESFTATGLRLRDGTELACDLVVLATGYENQQEGVRRMFGDDVADKVGVVWGHNEDGFMRNMWSHTAQARFWIMGGSLMECRQYSRFLALLIKADLEGLLPAEPILRATQSISGGSITGE
jgi:cation diffusion facilitator CzcD-associated flavoprotein CzcO